MEGLLFRKSGAVLLAAGLCIVPAALADGPPAAAHKAQQAAPIILGVSGSNVNDINTTYCCVGTLGSVVKKKVGEQNQYFILSNNHVLARSNGAAIGEAIMHRGYVDTSPVCSTNGTFTVANLSQFVPLNYAGANNTVDAAIAQIMPGKAMGLIMDLGIVLNYPVPAFPGLPVMKSGRTTGTTSGTVSAVGVTINVTGYGPSCGFGNSTAKFVNQIQIGPAGFSAGGDSGSLVVWHAPGSFWNVPVGLLFAGGANSTFANPISAVLSAFGVTFGEQAPNTSDTEEARKLKPDTRAEAAISVKDRHDAMLLSLPEVVGHGVGLSPTGEVVIRLFVRRLTDQARRAAPASLEGFRVELEETGEVRALPACSSCGSGNTCK